MNCFLNNIFIKIKYKANIRVKKYCNLMHERVKNNLKKNYMNIIYLFLRKEGNIKNKQK